MSVCGFLDDVSKQSVSQQSCDAIIGLLANLHRPTQETSSQPILLLLTCKARLIVRVSLESFACEECLNRVYAGLNSKNTGIKHRSQLCNTAAV